MFEFYKRSKKGCLSGQSSNVNLGNGHVVTLSTLQTDHERGNPGCKAMANYPIVFDNYLRNTYYFQLRIEKDLEEPGENPIIGQPTKGGCKISVGFCRDNFDLNKNAIVENKKKEYWVLDLFDGELFTQKDPYRKYIED